MIISIFSLKIVLVSGVLNIDEKFVLMLVISRICWFLGVILNIWVNWLVSVLFICMVVFFWFIEVLNRWDSIVLSRISGVMCSGMIFLGL